MRAIIRFSIDGEANSALRNKLSAVMNTSGFQILPNTATYENANITPSEHAVILNAFWDAAANHQGSGKVDHFWMYTDR
jgi:hypothetical protein